MTTMELIERGIGHNCLSDAYDLGRAEAIDEYKKAILTNKELQFAPYSQDMWFKNRIMDIAEQLKEKNNDK